MNNTDTFLEMLLGNIQPEMVPAEKVEAAPKLPTMRNLGGHVAKPWEVRNASGKFISAHYTEKAALVSFRKISK